MSRSVLYLILEGQVIFANSPPPPPPSNILAHIILQVTCVSNIDYLHTSSQQLMKIWSIIYNKSNFKKFCGTLQHHSPYKNEKVAARLQLGCCYYAAIKYVCNNWWRQSSQLEWLVACLQQPCSFYQRLQAHRATTRSQLQLEAVTSKKTARTHSL